MDIHLRIRAIWNNLQSSLWFRPIIAALLAIVLALGSTTLDSLVTLPQIFYLAPDNARLILSAIANSQHACIISRGADRGILEPLDR